MRAVVVILVLLLQAPSFAAEENPLTPEESFRRGLLLFEETRYREALEHLKNAYENLPVVGDYVLLYLAKAEMECENFEESLHYARKLLSRYPVTPLRQEARAVEIKNLLQAQRNSSIIFMESYIKDYPSDGEMKLLYGAFLNNRGEEERAQAVLKALYIEAGETAADAHELMKFTSLSREETLKRAENLLSVGRYGEAESSLRQLLHRDNYTPKDEVQKLLASALFRQKKYSEAARMFLKIDDLYHAARSFLRAGLKDEFFKTLDTILIRKDERGAELLVVLAEELRRDGDYDNALEVLEEAVKTFPDLAEEAHWTSGWVYYTKKDFEKAVEVFSRLHDSYGSNRYLYWKARSMEKTGKDATETYGKLEGSDFYTFLAAAKSSSLTPQTPQDRPVEFQKIPMERIDVLIEVGLIEAAETELSDMSRKDTRYSTLLNIAYRLADIEKYRTALVLVELLPDRMRPHEILYPQAYWPTVKEASLRYGIDPYLLLSLIREESRYDPEAVSSAGAIGLMQLMPFTARRTARSLDIEINGKDSIHHVENNINLGTHYLSGLLKEFNSVPLALAAYNAGEHRVRQWLLRRQYESYDEFIEDIPYPETRNYVKRILTTYLQYLGPRSRDLSGLQGKM